MSTGGTTQDARSRRAHSAESEVRKLEPVERRINATADAQPVREARTLNSTALIHIWQLFGHAVLDSTGATVGRVARVWADPASGRLQYLGLTTGRIRRQTHVIPARDANIDDHHRSIRVDYLAATIRAAPCHNTDVPLTSNQARKVDTYYDNR